MYLKESSKVLIGILCLVALSSCKEKLPEIKASLVTEETPHDTDDPAIWVNKNNPAESIVFGTDKDEVNGGVYAFDLDGKIIKEKSITGLSYPNNVDVAYDYKINDSTYIDLLVFTEREKNQFRVFSIPDMKMLDNNGFKAFVDESNKELRRPMGIAAYSDAEEEITYVIVSRKVGPEENYLYQYKLISDSLGHLNADLARKFGSFSGKKEIEAIAVDEELGFVYYSDEDYCIRKYHANPKDGNEEIACFGAEYFDRDIEGIAIAKNEDGSGYLIVSNQQDHSFVVFDRQTNDYIKTINLGTLETDGCDVTTENLGPQFPNGLFVSMNDDKTFYFHNFQDLGL
jgi:3-phytase